MTDLLFGPNVTLALIGAAGALAMFLACTPPLPTLTPARWSD